jgi:hypothetical protein
LNDQQVVARNGALDGNWRIGSRCTSGSCIQVRFNGGSVEVRDSKDPTGPVLQFSPGVWQSSLGGIVAGFVNND